MQEVVLPKNFSDWEMYKDINAKVVYIHLLLMMNKDESVYRGMHVPKNSVAISRQRLSDETGLTDGEVRGALDRLYEHGWIDKFSGGSNINGYILGGRD